MAKSIFNSRWITWSLILWPLLAPLLCGAAPIAGVPNGAGQSFSYDTTDSAQTVARKACEAALGSGNCSITTCGSFTYYRRASISSGVACGCSFPLGEYQWVYANSYGGPVSVGQDSPGSTGLPIGSADVTGKNMFTRYKSCYPSPELIPANCSVCAWRLALSDFNATRFCAQFDECYSCATQPWCGWLGLPGPGRCHPGNAGGPYFGGTARYWRYTMQKCRATCSPCDEFYYHRDWTIGSVTPCSHPYGNTTHVLAIFGDQLAPGGFDLRSWTDSELHWIGSAFDANHQSAVYNCDNWPCPGGQTAKYNWPFPCNNLPMKCDNLATNDGIEFGVGISQQTMPGTGNFLSAVVDPNNVRGDQMPYNPPEDVDPFVGTPRHCYDPASGDSVLRDWTRTALHAFGDSASGTALCRALGYSTGVLKLPGSYAGYNGKYNCTKPVALDSKGRRWGIGSVSSAQSFQTLQCQTFLSISCVTGFSGVDCKSSCPDNAFVPCNERGSCAGTCSCNGGWKGPSCQWHRKITCNNKGEPNPATGVCTCDLPGYDPASGCSVCLPDHYGDTCNYCVDSLCNGRGTCNTATGNCNCTGLFAGTYCEACLSNYYNYPNCTYCLAATSCANHGNCDSRGVCQCDLGWQPPNCATCLRGYFGGSCAACPGLSGGVACNGNGNCSDGLSGTGQCNCFPGYAGSACDLSDAVQCNNRGNVNDQGQCNCFPPYSGVFGCPLCNTIGGYYGTVPNCKRCDPLGTCSGHGTCDTSNGNCICNSGFAAPNCSSCITNYFGPTCKYCTTANCTGFPCNTTTGNCACPPNRKADCSDCLPFYYGGSCLVCPGYDAVNNWACSNQGSCSQGLGGSGLCSCSGQHQGNDCNQPTIFASWNPQSGPSQGNLDAYRQITLYGVDFGTSVTPGYVRFATTPPTNCTYGVGDWSATSIFCLLPNGQPGTNGDTSVTVVRYDGRVSPAVTFHFDAPTVSGIATPTAGVCRDPLGQAVPTFGTNITLTGSSFGVTQTVLVNGISRPVFTLLPHRQLIVSWPAGVGTSVSLQVVVSGQASSFSYVDYLGPSISSVSPASGTASTQGLVTLTILGCNFGPTGVGTASVTVDGNNCNIVFRNDTYVTCNLPAGTGSAPIVYTIDGRTANFAWSYAAPVVTSVSGCTPVGAGTYDCPSVGLIPITVDGLNFGATGALVHVNNVACGAPYQYTAHTRVICQLPPGQGTNRSVEVEQDGLRSAAFPFLSYRSPVVTPGSLRISQQGPVLIGGVAVALPNETLGLTWIEFDGDNFGNSTAQLTVRYGPSGDPSRFQCTSLMFMSATTLRCRLSPGTGTLLNLTVSLGGGGSAPTRDYIRYPSPVLTSGSLSINGAPGATAVTAAAQSGETLMFTGNYFGSVQAQTRVTYGPPADPLRYNCAIQSLNDSRITCLTEKGFGTSHIFRVRTGISSPVADPSSELFGLGSDTFSYPPAPDIFNVSGCPLLQGTVTKDCPTSGKNPDGSDVMLTIRGQRFIGSPCVQVGNALPVCGVTVSDPTKILLPLPAGVGADVSVVVSVAELTSNVFPGITYAAPLITNITSASCTAQGVLGVVNCPRAGLVQITLDGTNFGANSLVLIGGLSCTSLSLPIPHRRVTCTIPAGTFLNRDVLLIQDNGELSTNTASLSYTQCQAGRFAADYVIPCTLCNPGKFTGNAGQSACTDCLAGTVAAGNGNTGCLPCNAGQIAAGVGLSICTTCSTGRVATTGGLSTCTDCTPGRFSSSASVCSPCAAGSFQDRAGNDTCVQCSPGKYQDLQNSVSCNSCPLGTASNTVARDIACPVCPLGTIAALTGLTGCAACAAGTFSGVSPSAICSACPPGNFADTPGLSKCTACSAGSIPAVDSASCVQCGAGSYASATGRSVCTQCDAGSFNTGTGNVGCSGCSQGSYQDLAGMSFCISCPAGSVQSIGGQVFCSDCPAGSIANTTGLATCALCLPGSFTALSGRSTCSLCGPGQFAGPLPGARTCSNCGPTQYSNFNGASACLFCPPGSAAVLRDQCTTCVPGKFSAGNAAQCDDCPAGTYQPLAGNATCTTCPAGKFQQATGQVTCGDCPLGQFTDLTTGTVQCRKCDLGYYADATGSVSCRPCLPGYHTANSLTIGATGCQQCEIGTYHDTGAAAQCRPCLPGTFSDTTGLSQCTLCVAGQYSSVSGLSSCSVCVAGKAQGSGGQSSCLFCNPGTFSSADGAATCANCPEGTTGVAGDTTRCAPCGVGTYNNQQRATACTPCRTGTFSNTTGLQDCTTCGPGKYTPITGQTICALCPASTFAADGGAICYPCEPGRYSNTPGAVICDSCEVGKFSPLPTADCLPCNPGSYAPNVGQPLCSPCPPGSITTLGGQGNCTGCPSGTYQNQQGQQSCFSCPPGKFADNLGYSACVLCAPGRFNNQTNATQCAQCPTATSQFRTGQTACEACARGTFGGQPGLATCTPCDRGKYNNFTGRIDCTPCPPGQRQPFLASTLCIPCDVGTRNADFGTAECFPCDPGRYTVAQGAQTCDACVIGKAQNLQGQTFCDQCAPGTSGILVGASTCLNCEPGTFSNQTSGTTCAPCVVGTFTKDPKALSCLPCEKGTYASAPGNTVCTLCPPGFISDVVGQPKCEQCPRNMEPGDNLRTLCICSAGFMRDDREGRQTPISDGCFECKKGASCSRVNTTWSNVETVPGYWRGSSDRIYTCPFPETCGVNAVCGENRGGLLCAVCAQGYHETSGKVCSACQDSSAQSTLIFIVLVALIVLLTLFVLFLVLRNELEALDDLGVVVAKQEPSPGHQSQPSLAGGIPRQTVTVYHKGVKQTLPPSAMVRPVKKPANLPCFDVMLGIDSHIVHIPRAANPEDEEYMPDTPATPRSRGASGADIKAPPSPHNRSPSGNLFSRQRSGSADTPSHRSRLSNMSSASSANLLQAQEFGINLRPVRSAEEAAAMRRSQTKHRLKILITYFQIITSFLVMDLTLPQSFREAVGWLDFINLDFVRSSSAACVYDVDYYRTFVTMLFVPVGYTVLVALVYLIYPRLRQLCGALAASAPEEKMLLRRFGEMKFLKLITFMMFLTYPRVSALSLRMFQCKSIEGADYMPDYATICYDERWTAFIPINLVVIIVWVIGVPAFFLHLLHRIHSTHANRMPHIRYTLGFLFQQYTKRAWWFESLDMVQRLLLTSLLPFVALYEDYAWMQAPAGMLIVFLHTSLILLRQPYLLVGHERLHLFSQVSVFMVLLAASMYGQESSAVNLSEYEAEALSYFLILTVASFVAYFAYHFLNACRMYILVARNKLRRALTKRPVGLNTGPGALAPGPGRGSPHHTPDDTPSPGTPSNVATAPATTDALAPAAAPTPASTEMAPIMGSGALKPSGSEEALGADIKPPKPLTVQIPSA